MKIKGKYGSAILYATHVDDVTKEQVLESANLMKNNDYGKHLFNVAEGKIMY